MNTNMNPKDAELAKLLEASAENVNPDPAFIADLEDKLKAAHKSQPRWNLPDFRSVFTVAGWAGALAVLALVMNWAIHNLAPNPPQPATGPTPVEVTPTPFAVVATPVGEAYTWNGAQLYLSAPLPELTRDLPLYVAQAEQPATLESARALATQLGMNGQAYAIPPEVPGASDGDFLFVDGNQRLQVRSDQYFYYYPDYTRLSSSYNPVDYPNAETIIRDFLASRGFPTEVRIERTDMLGAYLVMPLNPEGYTVRHDYFSAAGFTFQFDKDGLFSVNANLVHYAPVSEQKYKIVSAEEAFQKFLDPNTSAGLMIGMTYPYQPLTGWTRPRAENETVTVWGWMNSFPSAENGAPLVSLDGFTAMGNISDFPVDTPNTFVEVTGQFQTVNGIKVFNVEAWKTFEGYEDGIFGALQRNGDNVVIVTPDRGTFILPDVPADVPVPAENMYATGVVRGDIFEWKTLDNRPSAGGGGGGGGGAGFYKLNLSGTPAPLPTAPPTMVDGGGGASTDGYPYVVVAGDTCQSIANMFIIDVQTLMAVNNLSADCSNLYIDQTLVIPYTTAMPPETNNLRGIVTITIYEQADGGQRVLYGFVNMAPANVPDTFYYYILEGDGLEELQKYNGRPVDVWGTVSSLSDDGIVKFHVDRFEAPFPDLQFQILKGTEKSVELDGQTVLLFTDENGQDYVELGPNCYDTIGEESVSGTGREGEPILLEALPVPGLTRGGYPALCIFSSSLASDPKTGAPINLTVSADQPNILPEPPSAEAGNLPTLTIENVELVYYVPNQRYLTPDPNRGPIYLQPVWRFYGRYSDGSIIEVLIQAIDPLFLLPETEEPYSPG